MGDAANGDSVRSHLPAAGDRRTRAFRTREDSRGRTRTSRRSRSLVANATHSARSSHAFSARGRHGRPGAAPRDGPSSSRLAIRTRARGEGTTQTRSRARRRPRAGPAARRAGFLRACGRNHQGACTPVLPGARHPYRRRLAVGREPLPMASPSLRPAPTGGVPAGGRARAPHARARLGRRARQLAALPREPRRVPRRNGAARREDWDRVGAASAASSPRSRVAAAYVVPRSRCAPVDRWYPRTRGSCGPWCGA